MCVRESEDRRIRLPSLPEVFPPFSLRLFEGNSGPSAETPPRHLGVPEHSSDCPSSILRLEGSARSVRRIGVSYPPHIPGTLRPPLIMSCIQRSRLRGPLSCSESVQPCGA